MLTARANSAGGGGLWCYILSAYEAGVSDCFARRNP